MENRKIKTPEEILKDKEKARERAKLWYINNRERAKETKKLYNEKTKEDRKKRDKIYREKNKEKIKIYKKNYKENNLDNEKILAIQRTKKWREKNPDYSKTYSKEYRKKNPEKVKNTVNNWRLNNPDYLKKRKDNEPLFKLKLNIRTIIYKSLYYKNYRKTLKTCEILGCSFEKFRNHLETLWSHPNNLDENDNVWMNWENYGNPKDGIYKPNKTWDIDHITPLSLAKTEEELIKLNHYTNLQPLCSYTNRFIKK